MRRETRSISGRGQINVFVSYSHKDAYWMEALMPMLRFPGVRVRPWNDKEIKPGLRWDNEIKDALNRMDVFIPLVSVNFAVSKYINRVESPFAKQRYDNGEIDVVPVLVHDPGKDECAWLMKLQRVPPGEKSWAEVFHDFQQFDMALTPIREGIKTVVERARTRKSGRKFS
ncbi:MAG TPA: toll/interleukin-1 receptor domain-containing protein [Pyrinomonadaceae bacterium]|nr:toll/interleukin-1 receptor domain-containing protein [Pyrinomonadaceae bacterium]